MQIFAGNFQGRGVGGDRCYGFYGLPWYKACRGVCILAIPVLLIVFNDVAGYAVGFAGDG
jgi:hypothetical protein